MVFSLLYGIFHCLGDSGTSGFDCEPFVTANLSFFLLLEVSIQDCFFDEHVFIVGALLVFSFGFFGLFRTPNGESVN